MKIHRTILLGISLVVHSLSASAQGFINSDFEDAQIVFDGGPLSVSKALPGWTVNAPYIFYDDVSLSGNSISIMDANGYPPHPVQGAYFVLLSPGNSPGNAQTISLGQTGEIPFWARTISFWGEIGGLQVTFAGHPLNFAVIGSTANYNVYGADVSAYAGGFGQLLFTLPPNLINPGLSLATLDNIQFSSSPIPEPSSLALLGLGVALLIWRFVTRPNERSVADA